MKKRKCFSPGILENVSNILGDTNNGLTGSEIHRFLLQANIADINPEMTKRTRLYNAFVGFQNEKQCSNHILNFISLALEPSRFVNDKEKHRELIDKINRQLAFVGYKLNENGKFSEVEKANTIEDVLLVVNNLKHELEIRQSHSEIFKYCTPELLQENYFHAVFEANKGLFQRIRDLSGSLEDGNKLIENVFSTNPVLIINDFKTQSEIDEHKGFCNLLKGLCGMFRNPSAHEPKLLWNIEKQDALDILGLISYCHRRLDRSQKIRIPD